MIIQTTWEEIKTLASNGWAMYHSVSNSGKVNNYYVYCANPTGGISFSCLLVNNSSEFIEFETIYKINSNKSVDMTDGKLNTYTSPRPPGTITYFTSVSDDPTNSVSIGGGEGLYFKHLIDSTSNVNIYYRDFNVVENRTYIYDANITWFDAQNDKIRCEIVPKVTDSTASVSTNYNLYNGYLIIPAAGDGTIDVNPSDIELVESPINKLGIRQPAFWNATWNTTTKKFENILPAPLGNGQYNMFAIEVSLIRFVYDIILDGVSSIRFYSKDINEIYTGMRFKFSIFTSSIDHTWETSIMLMMYREKTV